MFLRKAYAVISPELPPNPLEGKWTDLQSVLGAAINVTFFVALAIVLIFMILGGIKYATSGGDPKSAAAAKETVTHSLIGAVIVVAFRAIFALIMNLLGGTITNFLPGY